MNQESVAGVARVLLVEDHPLVLEMLRITLSKQEGLEIAGAAEDGERALALFRHLRPDLVVLDLKLPKLSGVHVARAMRAERRDVRLVVYTGHDDEASVNALRRIGIDGFVPKTASVPEVVNAVRRVAGGERLLPASQAEEGAAPVFQALTRREEQVLGLVCEGLRNVEIARALQVAESTVEFHLRNLFRKLDARSRADAMAKFYRRELQAG